MIPPEFLDVNGSAAEGRVFAALARLPDDVVVFHSRRWQDRSGARVEEGEADFVIVDPNAGVLVAEVKGGAIEQRDGAWYQGARGQVATQRIDPAGQARKSMHMLRRRVDERVGANTVLFGQFVWFPDVVWASEAPLDCPAILDARHLDDPRSAIASVFAYWRKGRENQAGGEVRVKQALIDLLAPTMRMEPSLTPDTRDNAPTAALVTSAAPAATRPVDRLAGLRSRGWALLAKLGQLAWDGLRFVALLPVTFVLLVVQLTTGLLMGLIGLGWRGWRAVVNFALGAGLIGAGAGVVAYFGFHAERSPIWIGSCLALAFAAYVLNTLSQGLETHATRAREIIANWVAGAVRLTE